MPRSDSTRSRMSSNERSRRSVNSGGTSPIRRRAVSGLPQVNRRDLDPLRNDLVGESELPIQLERSCMDGHGARVGPRAGVVIDDSKRHTAASKTQREHETGWTGSDNQDGRRCHDTSG